MLILHQAVIILDNSVLWTLWQQFGEDPSLFQHDNDATVHKVRSIKKCLQVWCGKTCTQSPEARPTPLGWTGNTDLEPETLSPSISVGPHSSSCGRMGANPRSQVRHLVGRHLVEAVEQIDARDLRWSCSTITCGHNVRESSGSTSCRWYCMTHVLPLCQGKTEETERKLKGDAESSPRL